VCVYSICELSKLTISCHHLYKKYIFPHANKVHLYKIFLGLHVSNLIINARKINQLISNLVQPPFTTICLKDNLLLSLSICRKRQKSLKHTYCFKSFRHRFVLFVKSATNTFVMLSWVRVYMFTYCVHVSGCAVTLNKS